MRLPELDPSTLTTKPSPNPKHGTATIVERRYPATFVYDRVNVRIKIQTPALYKMFTLDNEDGKLTAGSETNLAGFIATYVRIPLTKLTVKLNCLQDQFLVSLRPDILLLFKDGCKHLLCYCCDLFWPFIFLMMKGNLSVLLRSRYQASRE